MTPGEIDRIRQRYLGKMPNAPREQVADIASLLEHIDGLYLAGWRDECQMEHTASSLAAAYGSGHVVKTEPCGDIVFSTPDRFDGQGSLVLVIGGREVLRVSPGGAVAVRGTPVSMDDTELYRAIRGYFVVSR